MRLVPADSLERVQARGAEPELLAAAAGRSKGVRLLNAPADEPASRACERLGARRRCASTRCSCGSSRAAPSAL